MCMAIVVYAIVIELVRTGVCKTVNQLVVGSIPTAGANQNNSLRKVSQHLLAKS